MTRLTMVTMMTYSKMSITVLQYSWKHLSQSLIIFITVEYIQYWKTHTALIISSQLHVLRSVGLLSQLRGLSRVRMRHLGGALTLLLHVRLRVCACVRGRRHFGQTSYYYAAGYPPPLHTNTLSNSTQCPYLHSELTILCCRHAVYRIGSSNLAEKRQYARSTDHQRWPIATTWFSTVKNACRSKRLTAS